MKLLQHPLGLAQVVKRVVEEHEVNAPVGEPGLAIRPDGLHVRELSFFGHLPDRAHRQGVNVEGIDLPRAAHHFGERDNVASRAAAIIEHVKPLPYAHLLQYSPSRQDEVPHPEPKGHPPETEIR